jgi:hypothetical protein
VAVVGLTLAVSETDCPDPAVSGDAVMVTDEVCSGVPFTFTDRALDVDASSAASPG